MFTIKDILETNQMITQNNLDVRTITMGISLRDCGHPDIKVTAQKVYDKITRKAEKLVQVGEELEMELGVPIINKRISVTPVSMPWLIKVIPKVIEILFVLFPKLWQ